MLIKVYYSFTYFSLRRMSCLFEYVYILFAKPIPVYFEGDLLNLRSNPEISFRSPLISTI